MGKQARSDYRPNFTMTAGDEATNVVVVNGDLDYPAAVDCYAQLYDANGLEALAAAFHLGVEALGGTEITATDKPGLFFTTNADGAFALEATDVVGASGATVQLVVTPLDVAIPPKRIAVVFD